MIPSHLTQIRRRLRTWFAHHARDLPWRRCRDPYRIWISEVMLQQTQVTTVIPYFERFLARFPNLSALAEANEQDVLRLWEGLGYYRRARDLHRAAKMLIELNHTTLPDDPELVSSLPGFGRYTLGAVLSQAYEHRLPILEANSRRVLCRLFGIEEDPQQPAVQKKLWDLAEQLLPRKSIGSFNQSLMELGALVCTPTNPGCGECPLADCCQAHLRNLQDQIPRRTKAVNTERVEETAIVLQHNDAILLVQRPAEGRWANLWECPHHPLLSMESHPSSAQRMLDTLGIAGEIRGEIATIRHTVTRFHITMVCLEVAYQRGSLPGAPYASSAWVPVADLHAYPLSSPQRQLVKRLSHSFPKK